MILALKFAVALVAGYCLFHLSLFALILITYSVITFFENIKKIFR